MPPLELKEWIPLIKDGLLGIAALVTTVIAIYGARVWKRELAGKEIYAATKNLVKESHLLSRATTKARQPIQDYERKAFSEEDVKLTTKNERWRLSEADAYRKRIDDLSLAVDRYQSALLEVRVLVGSKIYLGFLPFGRLVTEVIHRIDNYIVVIQGYSQTVSPDSPEVLEAQQELYPSENLDDELTQKIGDAREEGEQCLLSFLHRTSIRG
ncbi:MAG: hypothetical protein KGZ69_12925 [Methylomonas sp.]|nr:hypothetical protein [Methylomonas sp.]